MPSMWVFRWWRGKEYTFPPQPQFIMEILEMGGAVPYYKKRMGRGNFLRG